MPVIKYEWIHCSECTTYSYVPGGELRCNDCRLMDGDLGEVNHDRLVRCPKCGYREDPQIDDEDGRYHCDGNPKYQCSECEHEYKIIVCVSYSFDSPAMEPVGSLETGEKADAETKEG